MEAIEKLRRRIERLLTAPGEAYVPADLFTKKHENPTSVFFLWTCGAVTVIFYSM